MVFSLFVAQQQNLLHSIHQILQPILQYLERLEHQFLHSQNNLLFVYLPVDRQSRKIPRRISELVQSSPTVLQANRLQENYLHLLPTFLLLALLSRVLLSERYSLVLCLHLQGLRLQQLHMQKDQKYRSKLLENLSTEFRHLMLVLDLFQLYLVQQKQSHSVLQKERFYSKLVVVSLISRLLSLKLNRFKSVLMSIQTSDLYLIGYQKELFPSMVLLTLKFLEISLAQDLSRHYLVQQKQLHLM